MKIQLAFISALLALSVSSAQAADTRTPDILSSVSSKSMETMSKANSSNTRGEYLYCSNLFGHGCTRYSASYYIPTQYWAQGTLYSYGWNGSYYASR